MDEVHKALAGVLANRAATAAAAGDEEQRPDIRLFLGQQIFFDRVAHFERARLRRARGQAELDRNAALILIGQKSAWQAKEEEGEGGEQHDIDAEEQPFAVDDLGDAADIAVDRAVEARVEAGLGAFEEGVDAREAPAVARVAMLLGFQQGRGQRGAQDQRDEHRQGHCRNDGDRELAIDDAGRPAEKGHRQEHRRQHERDGDKRDLQFLHRLDRRLARRHAWIFFHQSLDILDHDDRVVDKQPDRERQPEQGQRVDAEAQHVEYAKGAEQHDGHCDRGDQHRAPALQEDEHHEDHEQDRLEQRFLHLTHRQLDEGGRIIGIAVGQAVGEIGAKLGHPRLDAVGGLECVGARRQRDRHARSGVTIDTDDRAVIFGADLDPRDILDPHRRAIGQCLQHDILELFDRLHP